MLQQKTLNMKLNTEHFHGQKQVTDDDFKTIVTESTCLHQVMRKCEMLTVSKEKILKRIEDLDIDISHFKSRKTPSVYISRSKVDAIDEETFKTLVKNNRTWPKLALTCGFKSSGAIKNVARRVETLDWTRAILTTDELTMTNYSWSKDVIQIQKASRND